MAKIRKTQALVPSVLDRLMHREKGRTRVDAASGRKEQLLRDLKQCVRRDLEDLLNTRRRWLSTPALPEDLSELEVSLVNYGIPDFTGASLTAPDQQDAFCRTIEAVITRYEPRFRKVEVTLLRQKDPLDRTLRFRIDALLEAEPSPVPVSFDSVLEPVSGSFEVRGGTQA